MKLRWHFHQLNIFYRNHFKVSLDVLKTIFIDFCIFIFITWDPFWTITSYFQLPLLASTAGDILEVFLIKHSLICTQFGRFSFASKTFRPETDKKRAHSPTRTIGQETSTLVKTLLNFSNLFMFALKSST